ncbi:MAG: antibiotic biosynthesis monooxygenase family protein [Shimia sp.]
MYLAMNRFTVPAENAAAFEDLWLNRESHLHEMDGFEAFHMLRGPAREDGTILFASHTVWRDEAAFLAWTRSQAFRDAHKGAGGTRTLYDGHPRFEGFTAIQSIAAPAAG